MRHLLGRTAVNLRLRSKVLAVVPRTRWGVLGSLVTPAPHSPPSSAGHADLRFRRPLLQYQCAHAHLVFNAPQPRAGGTYRQVVPFPIDLGRATSWSLYLTKPLRKCAHIPPPFSKDQAFKGQCLKVTVGGVPGTTYLGQRCAESPCLTEGLLHRSKVSEMPLWASRVQVTYSEVTSYHCPGK